MEDRPIIRLSEEIIGKIAAGEVVESPAAAIKELIENSLDAGATCVNVEIREGGIAYLRVTDNGRGIPARDVRLAFERHATSKIRRSEDLFDLHTLGFRGEALASLAAVSRLTLTTRTAAADAGTRAVNEGGVIRSITEAASPQGTTIVARELFYNTPVRLKFLKKPATEAARVAEVVSRMILAHPDVSFRLTHNGKQIYASSGSGDLRSAVFALYGREEAGAMLPVHSEGSVSVDGLVGVGPLARANRTRQTFIVNGRTIRSPLLTQALEEGCRERVTISHYPTCVLNIHMPVAMVDVNVHPNKLEVRFSDERLVFQAVSGAVKDSFAPSPLENAPQLTLSGEEQGEKTRLQAPVPGLVRMIDTQTAEGLAQAKTLAAERESAPQEAEAEQSAPAIHSAPERGERPHGQAASTQESAPSSELLQREQPSAAQHAAFTSFVTQYFGGAALRESAVPAQGQEPIAFAKFTAPEKDGQKGEKQGNETCAASAAPRQESAVPKNERKQASARQEGAAAQTEPDAHASEPAQQRMAEVAPAEDGPCDALAGYRLLGVAFDTYIMLQNDRQIIFIDQHAAHERILYEKLMREIDRGTGSQLLLTPQVVQMTPQECARVEAYAEEIRAAGFDIEPFGDNAYTLRAVPNVLGVPQSRAAFLDVVDHLGELRVLATQQKRRDAILQMACKKAVKGGDKLSLEEIRPLLRDMIATGALPTCPHGRPLAVVLTRSELERRFRRIND